MGIDVAIARGLDIVVLDNSLRVAFGPATLRLADLRDLIRRTEPDVIAIDSPPAWGVSGKSRPIERQLQAIGISIFPTPAAEFARDLHRWMERASTSSRLLATWDSHSIKAALHSPGAR
jgi:predicted nuclease with RNAse H fold